MAVTPNFAAELVFWALSKPVPVLCDCWLVVSWSCPLLVAAPPLEELAAGVDEADDVAGEPDEVIGLDDVAGELVGRRLALGDSTAVDVGWVGVRRRSPETEAGCG